MLLAVTIYALVPVMGMTAHRFLPPHEHLHLGAAPHTHGEHESHHKLSGTDDCGALLQTHRDEKFLVHSAFDAGAVLASALPITLTEFDTMVLRRDIVARLAFGFLLPQSQLTSPPDPPPNR